MFISEVLASENATNAAAAAGDVPPSALMQVMPILLILFIFYIFLIRPQSKRMKEHKNRVNAIVAGDRVVCAGMMGRVVKVLSDTEIEVEIASGVNVKYLKDFVTEVISKSELAVSGNDNSVVNDKKDTKAERLKQAFNKK